MVVAVAVAAPIPAAAAECAHIDLHLYISRTMCYTGNHVRMYSYMRICVHLRVYPQIHRHIQQMYVVPFCLVCWFPFIIIVRSWRTHCSCWAPSGTSVCASTTATSRDAQTCCSWTSSRASSSRWLPSSRTCSSNSRMQSSA